MTIESSEYCYPYSVRLENLIQPKRSGRDLKELGGKSCQLINKSSDDLFLLRITELSAEDYYRVQSMNRE
jgi:hypothetical protein